MQKDTMTGIDEERYSKDMTNNANVHGTLRPNDSRILNALNEDNSVYTFSGIMRKIGMHQESLSRSLQRLFELDLVERSETGYKLSKKGSILKKQPSKKILFTPILRAYLPTDVDVAKVIDGIRGRWFKNLRWVGIVENKNDHLLQWIDELGLFQINLRIVPNSIIIETNAKSDKVTEALVSVFRIVQETFKSILEYQKTSFVNYTKNVLAN